MNRFKRLVYDETNNSDLNCRQLDRLRSAFAQKLPVLVSSGELWISRTKHEPHITTVTRQKLQELGWEVQTEPDLTPSDYLLYLSAANDLAGKALTSFIL